MKAYGLVGLVLAVLGGPALADWPQFRGPGGLGVSTETGLPLEWSDSKNIVWKAPLPGPGSSSPIVFGDRVYVTCYSGYGLDLKAPGNLADLKRHLVCVARDSGKVLWTRDEIDPDRSDPPYRDANIALHGYASHTPTADASGVYAYFGSAGAAGYSHVGEKKWLVRLGTKGKAQLYGSAASPVLHGNLLIVNAAVETAELYRRGDLVALDKRTGREVWREKAGGEWSSPFLAAVGGRVELVVGTHHPGPWLGLDPATGKRLWECKAKQSCGTPVAHAGVIYTAASEGRAAIRAGGRGDVTATHKLWEAPGGPRISSPVYHDGHLYWSNDGHIAHCADARTGKSVYRERLGSGGDCYASPVVADGRIYYVSRDMSTYVLDAGPKFKLLAHNKIASDRSVFNGSPAVSRGRLFLRSNTHLYCLGEKK
ncbi:MAG: PQQ-binding-like beta-propeller repeat protein [Gemmataceae bacterium]|nr:PQQ-binding-like beta-propeller repeat protein [Gemmataceae bacterium]